MLGAETEKRARTRLQRISGMGPGPPPSLGLSPPDNQMWVTEVLPRAARTQCMALIFCEPSPDRAVGSAGSWGRSVQDTDGTRTSWGEEGIREPRPGPTAGTSAQGRTAVGRPQTMPSAQDSPPQGSTTDNCGTLEGRDA
nr:uncharacterized protein LOC112580226 isoform X4 [Bubalus bubalis]